MSEGSLGSLVAIGYQRLLSIGQSKDSETVQGKLLQLGSLESGQHNDWRWDGRRATYFQIICLLPKEAAELFLWSTIIALFLAQPVLG